MKRKLNRIICFFKGHQMYADIYTHTSSGDILKRYDTTICQRCDYKE